MHKYTEKELIGFLENWYKSKGRVPSLMDWNIYRGSGVPSSRVYRSVFGSWRKAIVAAGYTPNEKGISDKCREAVLLVDRKSIIYNKKRGRNRVYYLDPEEFKHAMDKKWTISKMSLYFKCSRMVIRTRIKELEGGKNVG